jgi:FlaA1/EpsC-like NDP-sugar epimerase
VYRTRYAPSLGGATPFRPFSERKTAARDLIRLSGLEEGTDIEIEFVGVRPGEKLYEEVFFGHEDVRSTHHPKVLRTISTEPDAGFADAFDALIRQVTIRPVDEAAVRDTLRAMVPDFAREDARANPRPRPSPYPGSGRDK